MNSTQKQKPMTEKTVFSNDGQSVLQICESEKTPYRAVEFEIQDLKDGSRLVHTLYVREVERLIKTLIEIINA